MTKIEPAPGGRPPLALLADRNADTRQLYCEFLRGAGWWTAEATDGRQALVTALDLLPDAMVTAARLPKLDGYAVCRRLRRDARTRRLVIVFVTGEAFPRDRRRAREAGADAVLVKPCLPQSLLGELDRLLRSRRAS